MSDLDIPLLNERFECLSAEEVLAWAWETFDPKVIASSSFQTQSVPLLHLISRVCPKMSVIFIDTGHHFSETLSFRDELCTRFGLNIVVVHPIIQKSQLLEKYGEGLYRHDPDLCCYINKVEPMRRSLSEMSGWVTGVQHDQTAHRKNLHVLEPQSTGLLRIHPMINWTEEEVWEYINEHKLPFHPLFSRGYQSVGCAPCTRPVYIGEDERAGRWADMDKTECGLHLDWNMNSERSQNGQSEE